MSILQAAFFIGLMLGTFCTPLLHRFTSKRFGVVLGTAAWALFQLLPVVLRLLEWFPANTTLELVVTLTAMKFMQGVLLQQAYISFGSMMADVADEHEYNFGSRQEGIFFGAISFSGKATSGVGNFIGGIGLDLINWPTGTDIESAADIPPDTLVNLGLLYGPVVAAFAVVSVWCYSHYHLTRERHSEMLEELRRRRSQAEK
ncbi:MAG: MFS transporter [Gammaproteobacteria bacterium]|nr:MFS transporter [Gammaproteobacteria bacterium]